MPRVLKRKVVDSTHTTVMVKKRFARASSAKKAIGAVSKSKKPKKQPQNSTTRTLHLSEESESEQVKISIADNTKKKEQKGIVVRSQLQLALLSPFRFPIPQDRLVGNLARSAGVFFVFVGGLFTLLNLQFATGMFNTLSTADNHAQTIESTTSSGDSSLNTSLNTSISSIDSTPDVRISLEGKDVLTGTVPVMITVANALEVNLIAFHKSDNNSFSLGRAIKIDEFTWRYYWDTRKFPDGEYRFKTVIKNSYGTYDYSDSTSYEVTNTTTTTLTETTLSTTESVNIGSESTTSDPAQITASTTSTAPVSQTVTIQISEPSPVQGDTEIKIFVHGAREVKVYARNTRTYTLYYIGQAKYQSSDEWRLVWNTLNFTDDAYVLFAKAEVDNQTFESVRLQSTIDNVHEEEYFTKELSTTTESSMTNTDIAESPLVTTVVKPTIEIIFSKPNPVSGLVAVSIKTTEVEWVEIYAIPKSSLVPRFLGLAQKISATDWKYLWSTEQSPNGDYDIYARVKSAYGFTEGSRKTVRVQNQIVETFTPEQETKIDAIIDVGNSLVQITTDADDTDETEVTTDSSATVQSRATVYIEPVDVFVSSIELEGETEAEVSAILQDYRKSLDGLQNELARAIRTNDEEAIKRIKNSVENIMNDVLQKFSTTLEQKEMIDRINSYLSQISFELIELTTNNERIIKDRIGEAVFTDSDKDSITDYDEINLYHSNPFSADTDGDGYMDNNEITLGYDPLDSKIESSVVYESPKEIGVVRDDLLVVDSITTLTEDEGKVMSERPVRALLSGKALPNSFVTLYIYSTPIIVTVKTDTDGNWTYILDKDIEEGNHEVYVGITDNTGRIVAKSNPLSFIKTAEAFTGEGSLVSQIVENNPEPSLINTNALLLVASIAIVALGLVLILLGFHVRGTVRPHESESETAPAV